MKAFTADRGFVGYTEFGQIEIALKILPSFCKKFWFSNSVLKVLILVLYILFSKIGFLFF
jgi:hypothetical protein